jgi:hypothetical protein
MTPPYKGIAETWDAKRSFAALDSCCPVGKQNSLFHRKKTRREKYVFLSYICVLGLPFWETMLYNGNVTNL